MSLPAPASGSAVLVTGASSGIGLELARGLARRGHALILVARRRDRLEELAAGLREAHGIEVTVKAADLSDTAARRRLIRWLPDGPAIVGLCNNAGYGTFGRFDRLDQEREREEVRLNVVALHELTGEIVPGMVARGSGAILQVGSTAGFQPLPGNATYSATKAFVNAFSEALHAELSGTGVSCTVLAPGPVQTEFAEVAGIGRLAERAPGPVWASAEDVAEQAIAAMEAGRRSVVPGVAAKVAMVAGRHTPRTVLLPAVRAVTRRTT